MHFYTETPEGVESRHYVVNAAQTKKQGKEVLRGSRISDAKKALKEKGETWYPSVTTVMDILAKHALIDWKINEHLKVAWDHFAECDEGQDQWIKDVKRLTQEEMDKAPTAGTDFHTSAEEYLLEGLGKSHPHFELCCETFAEIEAKTGVLEITTWTPEQNFVSSIGYGGQIDLCGNDWIIDYKTKQTADKFKPGKMAYPDHARQLAAYREAVNPKARCANVFVCLEDGQIDFHEHKEEDLQKGWEVFKHCLAIWDLNNR